MPDNKPFRLMDLVVAARRRARDLPESFVPRPPRGDFAAALRGKSSISVIAEFKRRSPSRGAIAPVADVAAAVQAYEQAGVAAISVLTEPSRFGGQVSDLVDAAASTRCPLLMKDFVVEAVQVDLAASVGASGVLLIARCLDGVELPSLARRVIEAGMTPLVECHDPAEIERAVAIEGAVIGVNNRNLETLEVERATALSLLPLVPKDRIAVAESGYDDPAQLRDLRGLADAVLIGEALMRGGDPAGFVSEVAS